MAQPGEILHWSLYGQMGEPSQRRIGPGEWKTKPFKAVKHSAWILPIQPDQLTKLLNGFRPSAMEDKWFVYADGPDDAGLAALHMYRSWTGDKVITLDIEVAVKGDPKTRKAQVTAITWEGDEDRFSEKEAKNMALTVCQWVLGVKLNGESGAD